MVNAANTKKWRQIFGDLGEALARDHLQELGYRLLEEKYRAGRQGELDLVMVKDDWLIFVEVKTRLAQFGDEFETCGQMAIDEIKQKKILKAALFYLHDPSRQEREMRRKPRFDAVLVDFACSREKLRELINQEDRNAARALARITHVEAAFATL